jgi:hypothetical protein
LGLTPLVPVAGALVVVAAGAPAELDPEEADEEEPHAAVASADANANANATPIRAGARRMKPLSSGCLIGGDSRGLFVTLGFSQVNARSKRKCGATVGA